MLSRPVFPIPMLPTPVFRGPVLMMPVLPGLLRTPLLHTRLLIPSKHAALDVAGTAVAIALAPNSEHPKMTVERKADMENSVVSVAIDEAKTRPQAIT